MTEKKKLKARCLCGNVAFETPIPKKIDACHCGMCRRWNGGPYVGAAFHEKIHFTEDQGLTWYQSSDWAKRGFCKRCGASLFYCLLEDPTFWSISAGAIDLPEGLRLAQEIFIDEKPDYYAFSGEQEKKTSAQVMAEWAEKLSS